MTQLSKFYAISAVYLGLASAVNVHRSPSPSQPAPSRPGRGSSTRVTPDLHASSGPAPMERGMPTRPGLIRPDGSRMNSVDLPW